MTASILNYINGEWHTPEVGEYVSVIFQLIHQLGLPKGVINLVNGAKEAVDAILDHPAIRAVTFVGATATARYIYRRAAENGKRV